MYITWKNADISTVNKAKVESIDLPDVYPAGCTHKWKALWTVLLRILPFFFLENWTPEGLSKLVSRPITIFFLENWTPEGLSKLVSRRITKRHVESLEVKNVQERKVWFLWLFCCTLFCCKQMICQLCRAIFQFYAEKALKMQRIWVQMLTNYTDPAVNMVKCPILNAMGS